MKNYKFIAISISTALLLSMSGCGGDSSSDDDSISSQTSDTTSDPYARSVKVEDAIKKFETFDPTKDSVTEELESVKSSLLGTNNKDELVLLSLIDIAEIVNSDAAKNLVSTDSSTPNLDLLINDTRNVDVKIATAATMNGGTEFLHTLADRLRADSDTILSAFPEDSNRTVQYYENEVYDINDARYASASALFLASQLDFVASYSYGDVDYFRIKNKTIDGINYEYREDSTNHLKFLNQDTFFKMENTSRLNDSKESLIKSATLMDSLDENYTVSHDIDTQIFKDILDAFNGDGILSDGDTNINVVNLFSSSNYIDRDDLNVPSTYLVYNSNVIAENIKASDLYSQTKEWVEQGCNGDKPSASINWSLINNAVRDFTISYTDINETASIMRNTAMFMQSKPQHFIASDCSFQPLPNDDVDYGLAVEKEEITPKESINDILLLNNIKRYIYLSVFFSCFVYSDEIIINHIQEREFSNNSLVYVLKADKKFIKYDRLKKKKIFFNLQKQVASSIYYVDGTFSLRDIKVSFKKAYFFEGDLYMQDCNTSLKNIYIKSKTTIYKHTLLEFKELKLIKNNDIFYKFKYIIPLSKQKQ